MTVRIIREYAMYKKYEFTGESKDVSGVTLRRIRRLSDGLVGGWIEKEENLSQDGTCFVFDSSEVYQDVKISEHAVIFGSARLSGCATLTGRAMVYGNAIVAGNAKLSGNVEVYGRSIISGDTTIMDSCSVSGNVLVIGKTIMSDTVIVRGDASVCSATLSGRTILDGHTSIHTGAMIHHNSDVITFSYIGDNNDTVTAYRTGSMGVDITQGIYKYSLKDFVSNINANQIDDRLRKEYLAIVDVIKIRFGI